MNDRTVSNSKDDPMYVGFLPAPPRQRRFLMLLIPAMMIGASLLAATLALGQRDPGDGVWSADVEREFTGILLEHPYPMLISFSPLEPEKPVISLLVQPGKHGAQSRTAGLNGSEVRILGSTLVRDGRRLIELSANAGAVKVISKAPQHTPLRRITLGKATLRGEIIDSQCYLGAMKPGNGKPHKVCAALCIAGGVPPMLVTRDADGKATYYLLMTDAGDPANDMVTPFLGVPIEITGALQIWGDLSLLTTGGDLIRRL